MKYKVFESSDKNVWKYVYDFGDAIAEAVLYKYETFEKRTVICCSVQSGCPVGCSFCGTGKRFIRNLSSDEIVSQVINTFADKAILDSINDRCEKLQIMFMSMGEPILNFDQVRLAIIKLNRQFSNAQLLISTMAPKKPEAFGKLFNLSKKIDKVGLQFSIHSAFEKSRNKLIPYKNKYNLREIREIGIEWNKHVNRRVYLNYCAEDITDLRMEKTINRFLDLFPPNVFSFTFSVVCEPDETIKSANNKNRSVLDRLVRIFTEAGYNARLFDPAGQDDIGGGCGQLWYTQDWMAKRIKRAS